MNEPMLETSFIGQPMKMWATMPIFKELEKLAGVEHDPSRYTEVDIEDLP